MRCVGEECSGVDGEKERKDSRLTLLFEPVEEDSGQSIKNDFDSGEAAKGSRGWKTLESESALLNRLVGVNGPPAVIHTSITSFVLRSSLLFLGGELLNI